MELYLDSANLKEIKEAFKLQFLKGLTTTPTFMKREGIVNIDETIKELSGMVPILQIESLGHTAEDIVAEAERLLRLGLKKEKTVFKIPVSLEGVRACKMLREEGVMVNIHLVYSVQQAYTAMVAGANYICILVGRMQDQGFDALHLVRQCVEMIERYRADAKIMFSSVRNVEHVRNAIDSGAHVVTLPFKILKQMMENNLTDLGVKQFNLDHKLMNVYVHQIMKKGNPIISADTIIWNVLSDMTKFGFGAVIVIDESNDSLLGVFTDGDLRRNLQGDRNFLGKKIGDLKYGMPKIIDADALLNDAVKMFKETKVDSIVVLKNGKPIGMLDVQDIIKELNVSLDDLK